MSRRGWFSFSRVFKLWIFCVFTSVLTFVLIHLHRGFQSHSTTPEISYRGSQANVEIKRIELAHNQIKTFTSPIQTKWIVLDAIGSSCNNVANLNTMDGWRTIVVAHHNHEIKDCWLPKCQFLTSAKLYPVLGHLSTTKLFTTPSKISGYLMALSQGATHIFDGKCTNGIFNLYPILDSIPVGNVVSLIYNNTHFFNPLEYSDSTKCASKVSCLDNYSTALNSTVNLTDTDRLFLKDFNEVSVVQLVAYNGACSEAMKTGSESWLPSIVVGPNALTSLETGSTLFYGDAIQWMFLPTEVPKWFSEIFRTFSMYALKKSLLLNVAIRSTYSKQTTTDQTDCELRAAPTAIQLNSVFSCVENARCRQGDGSVLCGIQLMRKVFKCMKPYANLVNKTSVTLNSFFNAWMEDYQKLTARIRKKPKDMTVESAVEVRMGLHKHIWTVSTSAVVKHIYDPMIRTCPRLRFNFSSVWDEWKHPVIGHVVLVMVVNDNNIIATIPYLELIHRKYFRYIVYCGQSMVNFRKFLLATGLDHITYISGLTYGVNFTYQCISHVMNLGLPVRGYLLSMDTVLLKPWMFVDLPRDYVWLPQGLSKVNPYKTKSLDHWMKWNKKSERKSLISIFEELQKAAIGNSQFYTVPPRSLIYQQFAQKFLKAFSANIESEHVLFRPLELFYFPEVVRNDYIMATELFLRFKAPVDMAVPVMTFGLSQHVKVIYMKGSSLHGENSKHPWFYFSEENGYFLSPFPLTEQLKSKLGRQFYCSKYLTSFKNSLNNSRKSE